MATDNNDLHQTDHKEIGKRLQKIEDFKKSLTIWGSVLGVVILILFGVTNFVSIPSQFSETAIASAQTQVDSALQETIKYRDEAKKAHEESISFGRSIRPGTIVAFAGEVDPENPPKGWLLCDGQALNSQDSKYDDLFRAIRTSWGNGTVGRNNGSDTDFNVPDLRGYFLRGHDPERIWDKGERIKLPNYPGSAEDNSVATHQAPVVGDHKHEYFDLFENRIPSYNGLLKSWAENSGYIERMQGKIANLGDKGYGGGNKDGDGQHMVFERHRFTAGIDNLETRPVNVAVNYLIKY